MGRSCWLRLETAEGRADWRLDDDALALVPAGKPAQALLIKELAGIAGDEYAITLVNQRTRVVLSKLGADGAPLLAALRKAWLPQRADALRLSGTGGQRRFRGALIMPDGAQPFDALLFDDTLAIARDGADVEPLFLALTQSADFEEQAYTVTARAWDGRATVFGRLAGQTTEFAQALTEARVALAEFATTILATHLPTLPPDARATLASRWLPGRVIAISEIEGLAPGFGAALRSAWIASLPRKSYADELLKLADAGQAFIGYARPSPDTATAAPSEGAETPAQPDADADAATVDVTAPEPPSQPAAPPDALLWLLVRAGERWFLEALSEGDHATYRFTGDHEIVDLVAHLLCAPQFSREALYMPPEKLVGARANLAIAAQNLPFLMELRRRFSGRVIHTTPQSWRESLSR